MGIFFCFFFFAFEVMAGGIYRMRHNKKEIKLKSLCTNKRRKKEAIVGLGWV